MTLLVAGRRVLLLGGASGPAAPTIAVVTPVTNPPYFTIGIPSGYGDSRDAQVGDIPELRQDATGSIYQAAALTNPIPSSITFSAGTWNAGSQTASARIERPGPPVLDGPWATTASPFVVPSAGVAVEATATTADSGTATTHIVNLPSGIQSGELLIVAAAAGGTWGPNISAPGWSGSSDGATGVKAGVFYRTADGTEGTTVTFTSPTSQTICFVAARISGWTGSIESGAFASGNSTNADPPALAPSWQPAKTLYMVLGIVQGVDSISAISSGYGNSNIVTTSSGTFGTLGVGFLTAAVASENPGAFISTSNYWGANTYAIESV